MQCKGHVCFTPLFDSRVNRSYLAGVLSRRHTQVSAVDSEINQPHGNCKLLTPEHQLEALSRAYVSAVAGRVGMTCSWRDFDYGIDVTLHDVTVRTNPETGRKRYFESGAALDVQIKSTTTATIENESVVYDLDADAYNDLCVAKICVPRILVLYAVPKSFSAQFEQDEAHLLLGGCSYWQSLRGCEPTANQSKKRVRIPRHNVFSELGLRTIMDRIREGGIA